MKHIDQSIDFLGKRYIQRAYKRLFRKSKWTKTLDIRRLVLDVMSPAQQSIVDLAKTLGKVEGTQKVDITLSELEKNVEDFKVTIEGESLDYEKIRDAIRDFGAVIRNVDNIISAKGKTVRVDNDQLSASMLVLAHHVDSNVTEQKKILDEFDDVLNSIKSLRR